HMNETFFLINFIWTILNTNKSRKFEALQKHAPEIFKPHYENIECHLFISLTEENKETIFNNLSNLYSQSKEKNLLFYISDDLLTSLEEFIKIYKQKPNNLKKLNNSYQFFSRSYFYELNRFRHIVGLKRRSFTFRIHHKLYRYHLQWLIIKYIYLSPILGILIYHLIQYLFELSK
ncbi:hypothetical protein, partial [Enterococcus hirae]|uniref:hypothetical protein n=1 Tax=Enterococcus hirae TaxID=1354 RepID=UPI001A96633D